ncbi:MAG: hemin uptake protein HemP [Pirellulales bacterium]|nr:hemin uptake protein HemP [Pirellulales bacterium]
MIPAEFVRSPVESSKCAASPCGSTKTPLPPIIYSSNELMNGRREVWIEHGDQMYRLRVTSAKKLYLTK